MRLQALIWGGLPALMSSVALAAVLPDEMATNRLEKRNNCGPGLGSCGAGMCCSKWGYCGTTTDYCGTGCQPGFGTCGPNPMGACGAGIGSCAPGLCCSKWGYCGTTTDYCGAGCQSAYGACSTGPGPLTPSPDDSCGPSSAGNYTCAGSAYGKCCSKWGWCGVDSQYCGAGCQPGYGTCS